MSRSRVIQAAKRVDPKERKLELTAPVTGWTDVQAAKGDDAPSLRKFEMTAYTGGAMWLGWWDHPVVIDLEGMQIGDKSRPILKEHRRDQIVGHTDSIRIEGRNLLVSGVISGVGQAAREVVDTSKNGFPWQSSMGAIADVVEFVPVGQMAKVNGQEFNGPFYISRKSSLYEISFVALGADDNTTAKVAAKAKEENTMDFEKWLEAKGFDVEALSDEQRKSLKAMHDAELEAEKKKAEAEKAAKDKAIEASKPKSVSGHSSNNGDGTEPDDDEDDVEDPVARIRASAAAEVNRIAAVRKVCDGKHPEIEAKAISEGWDATRTELEVLRASRPKAPSVHVVDNSVTGNVLEAACMISGNVQNVDKLFPEKAVEAAARRWRYKIGLQELLLEAAWANGYTGRTFKSNPKEAMRFAFGVNMQGAFSNVDIGGILSNVANKFLLMGFEGVEQAWRKIAAVRSVSDFKEITSYRLIGDDMYEEVGPTGELKHGTLGEQSYTNKADTFGKILTVSRKDIINDDMGAITAVPRKLGRGSGRKLNDVFWREFMNNGSFFTAGRGNFLSGAGSALGIDALTAAETAFMNQTDPDGNPLGIMPKIILVPVALGALATVLYKSLEIRDTTSSVKYPLANPHAGKFEVVISVYLGNAAITGNSTKKWYLIASPEDLATIEVAFLNGQESPTIETAEADFDVLGIRMRGYHDFGAKLQEHRGGVASKGEA